MQICEKRINFEREIMKINNNIKRYFKEKIGLNRIKLTAIIVSILLLATFVLPVLGRAGLAMNHTPTKANAGMYGGPVVKLAVSEEGTLYTLTSMNGIFLRKSNKDIWTKITPVYLCNINDFALSEEGALYLATENGVYKVTASGRCTPAFLFAKNKNIGHIVTGKDGLIVFSYLNQLFYTFDKGKSWQHISSPDSSSVNAIVILPENVPLIATSGGLFRIENGELTEVKLQGLYQFNVRSLAASPDGTIYAGTLKNGLFISESGQNKWKNIPPSKPINTISVSPNGKVFIFASDNRYVLSGDRLQATDNELFSFVRYGNAFYACSDRGVFKSTDSGETWEEYNDGLIATDINALLYDEKSGTLYAQAKNVGIFAKEKNSFEWKNVTYNLNPEDISAIALSENSELYAVSNRAIWVLKSKKWVKLYEIPGASIDKTDSKRVISLFVSHNMIYAGTTDGILCIELQAGSVKNTSNKMAGTAVTAIASSKNGKIFVGTSNRGIFVSAGSQCDFKNVTEKIYSVTDITTVNNSIYVSTFNDGVFHSDISSEFHFKQINNGLKDTGIFSLLALKSGVLLAGNGSGLVSYYFGGKWSALAQVSCRPVKSISILQNALLFVGTNGSGVFRMSPFKIILFKVNNPKMYINNTYKDIDPNRETKPVIIPEWRRTVIPVRALVTALGGRVSWSGTERKVTINIKDKTIELWIGNPEAKVNGRTIWIDSGNHKVKPIIMNGRTMIPLRFVAESLGCKVNWDGASRTILITYIN